MSLIQGKQIELADADAYFSTDILESALHDLKDQIGGTTVAAYGFGEDNVLADNDAVYAALNKLDLKWGDLASTANGEGASLVAIEDSGTLITATDVEGALAENRTAIDAIEDNGITGGTGISTSGTVGADNLNVAIDLTDSVDINGGTWTFTPDELQVVGTPDSANDGVNKAYVDSVAVGLMDFKASVRVVTVAALPAYTASGSGVGKILTADAVGILAVDSVNTVLGDRILVMYENAGGAHVDHGIYEVTTEGTAGVAFVLTRTTDADADADVTAGMFCFATEGATWADTGWILATNDDITVDTTTLTFVQFSGTGTYTAGDGLDLASGVFTVDVTDLVGATNGGISEDASNNLTLDLNDLAAASIDVTADSIAIIDANDSNGSRKESWNDIVTAAAGAGIQNSSSKFAIKLDDSPSPGLIISSEKLKLDLHSLSEPGAFDPAADYVGVVDVDDSNATGKMSWSTIASGIDGTGLTATNGVLSVDSGAGFTQNQEKLTHAAVTNTDTPLTDILTNTPQDSSKVMLFLNGQYCQQGAGEYYTISGKTITWLALSGDAPDITASTGVDDLVAWYLS